VSTTARLQFARWLSFSVAATGAAFSALNAASGHLWLTVTDAFCVAVSLAVGAVMSAQLRKLNATAAIPDYTRIAGMEREIYGKAFCHDGAPEPDPQCRKSQHENPAGDGWDDIRRCIQHGGW
jgi:hypothetical protein